MFTVAEASANVQRALNRLSPPKLNHYQRRLAADEITHRHTIAVCLAELEYCALLLEIGRDRLASNRMAGL